MKINLQLFAPKGETKTDAEIKAETEAKAKADAEAKLKAEADAKLQKEADEAKAKADEEAELKRIKDEALAKQKEEFEAQQKSKEDELSKAFDEKLKKMEEKSKKDMEDLLETIKKATNKDDIIDEMKRNQDKEEVARKEAERLEAVAESERRVLEAEKALKDKIDELKFEKLEREKEAEKAEFKDLLAKEMAEKPYLADGYKKILEEDDYEVQKSDYRFLKKFIDTESAKSDYEAKKIAGSSAFEGVIASQEEKDKNVTDVTDAYVSRILESRGVK